MKRKLRSALAGAVALAGLGSALFTSTAHAGPVVEVVKLQNGDSGLCLTSTNASVGQAPVMTQCAHAHNFVWDQLHDNIFVEGHPTACIASGDPGKELFIDPCSNGRSVLDPDGSVAGLLGTFIRFRWRNEGTFAEPGAPGEGQAVDMTTTPNESRNGDYWFPMVQP
jgi:hypothetical protein